MLKFLVLSLAAVIYLVIPTANAGGFDRFNEFVLNESLVQEFLAKIGRGFSDPRMREITQAAAREELDAIISEDTRDTEFTVPTTKSCLLLCESLIPAQQSPHN